MGSVQIGLPMRLAASLVAAAAAVLGGAAADPGRIATSYEDSAMVAALPEVLDRPEALDRSSDRTELDVDAAAIERASALSTQAAEISKASDDAKIAAQTAARQKALGYDPALKDPRAIARQLMLNTYGWGDAQFTCLDKILTQESQWSVTATNPSSGAYGIPQALPGTKMASAGADWKTNPATQITWALGYVKERYSTPCQAWSFKQAHGWY